MSDRDQDFAALARAMQEFFNAVDWRTDASVHAAASVAEAVHGHAAALEAMIRACDHLREEEHDECAFWMKVYGTLIAPEPARGGYVTLH